MFVGGAGAAQILGNLIANNTTLSGDGGGIVLFAAGTPTLKNNIITGNTATGLIPASQGGGIWIVNMSDAIIVQNLIYNNNAPQGSGVYFGVPSGDKGPVFVNNTIVGTSLGQGSAVYADGFDDQVQFFNNLLIGPTGGNAVFCDSTYDATPPTFTANDAYSSSGSGLQGTCAGQETGNGNLSQSPGWTGPKSFRLSSTSPAIDAGSSSAPNLPRLDIGGKPRIVDGNGDGIAVIDMGAYEFQ
jgi:parallel beta-helix repeat protein